MSVNIQSGLLLLGLAACNSTSDSRSLPAEEPLVEAADVMDPGQRGVERAQTTTITFSA